MESEPPRRIIFVFLSRMVLGVQNVAKWKWYTFLFAFEYCTQPSIGMHAWKYLRYRARSIAMKNLTVDGEPRFVRADCKNYAEETVENSWGKDTLRASTYLQLICTRMRWNSTNVNETKQCQTESWHCELLSTIGSMEVL